MYRPAVFAIALMHCAVAPVLAVEENEALVMRLVFQDCLGFMREDREPFVDLETGEPSSDAFDSLPTFMSEQNVVQVLSPRYVAAWGQDDDARFCTVRSVWGEKGQIGEPILGVDHNGFLKRVTAAAIAAGLTYYEPEMEFSPLSTTYWSEPETGFWDGAQRPITLTVMPTDASDENGLMDVGIIIMGGPTLPSLGD